VKFIIYTTFDRQEEILSKIQTPHNHVLGIYSQEVDVIEAIKENDTDFLLIHHEDHVGVFRLVRQVYRIFPKVQMVVFLEHYEGEVMYQLMHHGVNYIFPIEIENKVLDEKLKDIYQTERERLKLLQDSEEKHFASKIFAIYSGSGGSGKSVFASNFALLKAREGHRVALLDFDFAFGQLELQFDIKAPQSISDLLEGFDELDSDRLIQSFYVHPSGVHILASPRKLEYSFAVEAHHLEQIITLIRPFFDYIIIDMSSELNERNMTVLDLSSYVYLMIRQDLESLHTNERVYRFLISMKNEQRVLPILSQCPKNRLSKATMEKILQRRFEMVLPYDRKSVLESVNIGDPVLSLLPQSAYAKALNEAFSVKKKKRFFKRGD